MKSKLVKPKARVIGLSILMLIVLSSLVSAPSALAARTVSIRFVAEWRQGYDFARDAVIELNGGQIHKWTFTHSTDETFQDTIDETVSNTVRAYTIYARDDDKQSRYHGWLYVDGALVALSDDAGPLTPLVYVMSPEQPPCQPPSLNLFTPEVDGLKVSVNGVTMPGCSDAKVTRIHWEWGDGSSGDYWFPASHAYGGDGTYTIEVTSYQSDGQSTTRSVTVTMQGGGPGSLEITHVEYPTSVRTSESFTVAVTVRYVLDSPTTVTVDLYENAGPLLDSQRKTLSGDGSEAFDLSVTAPSTPRSRWQLNIHLQGQYKQPIYIDVGQQPPETSVVYVYALSDSYLGQDPAGLTGADLSVSVVADYVLNGRRESTGQARSTPYDFEADVGSEASFHVAGTPSDWEFTHAWDHWGHQQYTDTTGLVFQVPSGTQKVIAFFKKTTPEERKPPELFLFTPVVNGLTVSVDGLVRPGTETTSITNLSWDWGDGLREGRTFPASHTYSVGDTYNIVVAALQSDGLSTTKSVTVVTVGGEGTPPQLSLYQPQIEGLTVTINGDTNTGTPGSTITRLEWDWGDGPREDLPFPASHTYGAAGTYTVTVTSHQSDGLSTSRSVDAVVKGEGVEITQSLPGADGHVNYAGSYTAHMQSGEVTYARGAEGYKIRIRIEFGGTFPNGILWRSYDYYYTVEVYRKGSFLDRPVYTTNIKVKPTIVSEWLGTAVLTLPNIDQELGYTITQDGNYYVRVQAVAHNWFWGNWFWTDWTSHEYVPIKLE